VLTWGETPRDLDSHLDTPSGCHVFYGRKQCNRGQESLDTDVTNSFGPETINIRKLAPGIYKCAATAVTLWTKVPFMFSFGRYKVHAYSSGAIEQSEASVALYGVAKDPITFVVGRDGVVSVACAFKPSVLLLPSNLSSYAPNFQVKGGDWRVFNLKVEKNGRVTVTDPDAKWASPALTELLKRSLTAAGDGPSAIKLPAVWQ
jgi:hypothetical protein